MLQLNQLSLRLGGVDILRGVDLHLQTGERLALIGPNGAGKSSLFNVISGRVQCSAGQVIFAGNNVTNLPAYEIAKRGLSRSFQSSHLFANLSVFDHICCALMSRLGISLGGWQRIARRTDLITQAEYWLAELNLIAQKDHLASKLNYAQQRILEMGMSLASGAECILLDEPTSGMSRSEAQHMIALLRKLSEGKSLMFIEHDMQVTFEIADRIAVLESGRIIACDSPENIRLNPQVQSAYMSDFSVWRSA